MTDPLMWSPINLGRWAGTQVRVHYFLIVFVVVELVSAAIARDPSVGRAACWLILLLAALAVHELGHAAMAAWLGTERDDIRLWPLGNMVSATAVSRSTESALVAIAGPALNALIALVTAIALNFAHAQFVWNPFPDSKDYGAPFLAASKAYAPFGSTLWFIGWFGYLNWVLMLANLIPALPFDMGRIVRSYLANSPVSQSKDNLIAVWTSRTCAAVLVLVGLIRLFSSRSDGFTLIGLAVLIELMVRSEARMLEDGGFYEDGVFGYDFSEGYTSLEGSAAKVRPYRESALRRWRRKRSDLRRQRRQAREAAEERRMDEILEKLHRDGRSSLSDEEHRFHVRVSAKYRNRPKARE